MSAAEMDSLGSCQKEDSHAPPPLSIKLPKSSELSIKSKRWSDDPVDVVLLTVEDCEFLACYAFMRNPIRRYHIDLGHVYFGSIGDGDEDDDDDDDNDNNQLKVALLKCFAGSSGPSGAQTVVNDAVKILRPRAVFSVGYCEGLKPEKNRLGDVVVSSKLTFEDLKTPVGKSISHLIKHSGDGWNPPLERPNDSHQVKVHDGEILSCKDKETAKQLHSGAIAREMEGQGVFVAAHNLKMEWVIVKGISHFADSNKIPEESWKSYACVMAASLVFNMLNDTVVFQQWPHYKESIMAHSVNLSVPESREPSQQEDLPDERLTTTIEIETSQELRMEIEQLVSRIEELAIEIMQKDQMLKKADSDQTSLKQEITELQSQLQHQQEQLIAKDNTLIRCTIMVKGYKEQIHQLQNQITGGWIIERKAVTIYKSQDAILGRGALGTVYKGRYHNSEVAVKELHKNTPDNAEFLREINVAVNCHHPNVLHVYGVTSDNDIPLIVMELLDGSLRKFIDSHQHQQWLEDGKRLTLDIAQGLCYLHSKNPPIVHRDIKSDNILLKNEGGVWKAKVGDYGTAKVFCKEMTPNRGTLAYAAPEAQTKDQQSTKMDVYSFGVVLMEMCIFIRPVNGQVHDQIELVPGPKHKQLIERCTRILPEERPTMEEVIEILKEF